VHQNRRGAPRFVIGTAINRNRTAKEKKFITKRFIYSKKAYADGSFETPSDNAAAFSVIK
jgi:hypothetical protein